MNSLLTLTDLKQKSSIEERLKVIAAQLIAAHRRHDHALVIPYARQAGLAVEGQAPQKLFMRTIQVFHPDRLNVVWERVEKAHLTSDHTTLEATLQLLRYHDAAPAKVVQYQPEDEEYGFEEDDFSFSDGWDSDEGTFYSAVKSELFGNLEVYPGPADLGKLEGELDLSDYDLHDLDGVEYCVGLTVLNLSRNNLDNVFLLSALFKLEALDLAENDLEDADPLGALYNLRELDLSANEIDDIAFLERLPALRYVDLTGNPIRQKGIIAKLEARGVIVIY